METAKCNSTYRRYNDYLYDLEVLENIRLYDDYEAYKQDRLITLQAKKPMPTLESKREKLSRLVSQDYRISYNKELELRTNESLLALDKPKELEDDIDGVFVSDKVCSTYFTYGHTFSDVQSIVEKYDLDSGEEVFKRGLGETEALTGSVEKKRGMQLTDAQIESMGIVAPVDTDMEQPSLDEDEEDDKSIQLGLYNTDMVTDIPADNISPIVGAEPEPEPEFVVKGSSDLVEDNELDATGVAETEAEQSSEPEQSSETEQASASELEALSMLQSGYSKQASEPSESNDNSISDADALDDEEYLDEDDDEEYLDDEDRGTDGDEEYLDDEDTGAEEEDSEAPEEAVSEQVAETTDSLEYGDDDDEYLDDDDEEYLDDEDLADNNEVSGTEAEDLADTNETLGTETNDVPVNQPSPVEQPIQPKGYSHPQEQAQEPFNLDTSNVNIDFNGNNGRASPLHQPVQPMQKADNQGVTDEEKHDLRLFLRHHPRCEYSLVSQYFSKKEIQDNITRGKIIKRGKTLRLI